MVQNSNKNILMFFILTVLIITIIKPTQVQAFCVFCDKETQSDSGEELRYKQEKQFVERIKIIKAILGNSIDEITLAATVLQKENALQAVQSRYEKDFDAKEYKTYWQGLAKDKQTYSDTKNAGASARDTSGETVDLLNAAAIIMADSAGWTKPYNEDAYKKALAGDRLVGNNVAEGDTIGQGINEFYNWLFCGAGFGADAIFSAGNMTFQLATGQDLAQEAERTSTRWYNMAKICNSGYIGGVYPNVDKIKDETQKQAYKDRIAQEIIDLANYYKQIRGNQGNTCKTGGTTQATIFNSLSTEEYIATMGPIAQADYSRNNVFASVTLAQSIIESGWGKSGLTQQANNMFGIKCSTNWAGECINMATGEFGSGGYYVIDDAFRKYASIEESIEDHSLFLKENPRYTEHGVFSASNYSDQIKAIHNAGYATAPDYASSIIGAIQMYNLDKWDVKTNTTSNSGICSPMGSGDWPVRTVAPTSSDASFAKMDDLTNGAEYRGQCVWYAKGRAVEIVDYLAANGKITTAEADKLNNLLYGAYGDAGQIYDNAKSIWNGSTNIREPKAGSYIIWQQPGQAGHIEIVEEVNVADNTITLTGGWTSTGTCSSDWSCIEFQNRTMSLDEFYTGYGQNYIGGYNFVGYLYFLEPLN